MTTSSEIAASAAEEVFRVIERERMINKGQITEAIEKVLLRHQPAPQPYQYTMLGNPNTHQVMTTTYPYPGTVWGVGSIGSSTTIYQGASTSQNGYVQYSNTCCMASPHCTCHK